MVVIKHVSKCMHFIVFNLCRIFHI